MNNHFAIAALLSFSVTSPLVLTGQLNTILPDSHQVNYGVVPNLSAVTLGDLDLVDQEINYESPPAAKKTLFRVDDVVFIEQEIANIPARMDATHTAMGSMLPVVSALGGLHIAYDNVLDTNYAVTKHADGTSTVISTVAVYPPGPRKFNPTKDGRYTFKKTTGE